jgi:DNA polymerase IV
MAVRKIIHIDMDAFYASVEQRDFPEYKGKPVIVGGSPNSRGVVSTASYEARKFGVHSAMPTSQAYRLCPHGIFVHPRFEVYKEVSVQVREIFHEYTDLVEPLSLDEAYLDVTENKVENPSATLIALEIQRKVKESTQLTCSAGVSYNKFLAKVASGFKKPAGLTLITPEKALEFIHTLPIGKFYGVGSATEKKMKELGIHSGAELAQLTEMDLVHHFGKAGHYYFQIAHGIDEREVNPDRVRKSVGAENTFATDISDIDVMKDRLVEVADTVERRLKRINTAGRTLTLKIRYSNFEICSRSLTLTHDIQSSDEMLDIANALLDQTEVNQRPVRLLGISISNLSIGREESPQLSLGI